MQIPLSTGKPGGGGAKDGFGTGGLGDENTNAPHIKATNNKVYFLQGIFI